MRFANLAKVVVGRKTSEVVWENIYYYLNAFNDNRKVDTEGFTMLEVNSCVDDILSWPDKQPDTDLTALPKMVRGESTYPYQQIYKFTKYIQFVNCSNQGDLYRKLYELVLTDIN